MSEGSITTVEYTTLQDKTLNEIASEILFIEKQVYNSAIQGAISIGMRLQEAKEKAGHGHFEQWCKDNLNYSKRKAENFMRIYKNFGDSEGIFAKTQTSADFSISKALSLLALPEEDVETFVEEHNIEEMSVRDIDEEVRRLKEEKSKAEANAEAWKKMKEETESALALNEEAMAGLQNKITQLSAELRIKESEQAPVADVSEYEKNIEDLKAKLEKAKAKEQKLKADIQTMQASQEEEIKAAIETQRESLYEQAKAEVKGELDHAGEVNADLQTQIATLEKKLENVSNESKVRFKLLVDELQSVYQECVSCADEEEPETASKMKGALRQVMTSMMEVL